jgi:hypothetical protein
MGIVRRIRIGDFENEYFQSDSGKSGRVATLLSKI